MDIIAYNPSNPLESAREFQSYIVESMSSMIVSRVPSILQTFYNSNFYYVVKYDVQHNFQECKQFSMTFAKYPDIFLGKRRTEMQFDDVNITVSVNNWVECSRLPDLYLSFTIEYYIHTVNNLPNAIFFRIPYSVDGYEEKLKYFIDSVLLKNKQLVDIESQSCQSGDVYVPMIGIDQDGYTEINQHGKQRNLPIIPYQEYQNHIKYIKTRNGTIAISLLLGTSYIILKVV